MKRANVNAARRPVTVSINECDRCQDNYSFEFLLLGSLRK